MAYTKTVWVNGGVPAINATNLNHLEQGIFDTDAGLTTTNANLAALDVEANFGWFGLSGTWAYSSADAPTFVLTVNANVTTILTVGMRLKLTQTTVKYFIITAIGAYSGGNTLVTVYGGTDYTLVSAAVSAVFFSSAKAPFGFPVDYSKWSILVSSATPALGTPVNNVWWNPGSTQISIPIGKWRIEYSVGARVDVTISAGGFYEGRVALSVATNSASVTESLVGFGGDLVTAGLYTITNCLTNGIFYNTTSKIVLYLNSLTKTGGSLGASNGFNANINIISIRSICAYL